MAHDTCAGGTRRYVAYPVPGALSMGESSAMGRAFAVRAQDGSAIDR